jgi:hypothetical protein
MSQNADDDVPVDPAADVDQRDQLSAEKHEQQPAAA